MGRFNLMQQSFQHLIMPVLKEGDLFSSFEEFDAKFKQYKEQNYVEFQIRDGRTIEGAKKKCPVRAEQTPGQLKYYQVRFECVHGGKFKKKKDCKLLRRTSTLKQGCKAFIYLKVSYDGKHLVIAKMSEDHNHEVSKTLFKHLPKQRKLNAEVKKEVLELMALKVNKKLIQYKVQRDTGGVITLRDLSNIAYAGKSQEKQQKISKQKGFEPKEFDRNDLETVARSLESEHNCTVHLCIDQDKNLLGIFIQDANMKRSFEAYPELLCVGSTCKLDDLQVPLFVLLVEDGNGHNEVVAVGLLIQEYDDTLNWFFETFKILNPSLDDTKVILTDLDDRKRSALKQVFPSASLRIGLYHTLKAFNQDVSCEKMGMTPSDRLMFKKIFEQLCFATNEEDYDTLYYALRKKLPNHLFDYFNSNWHLIREEWSSVYASFFGSFLNLTNNRLESFNSKVKLIISSFTSLEEFVTRLITVLGMHRSERDANIACTIDRLPTNFITDDEKSYLEFLTPYAFKFLKQELELSLQEDTVDACEAFMVTESNCACNFRYSMYLPCRHIFALRRSLGLSLYDDSLCSERWSRNFYYSSQRNPDDAVGEILACDLSAAENLSTIDMDATSMSDSVLVDAMDISSAADVEAEHDCEGTSFSLNSCVDSLPPHQVEKFEKASFMINKLTSLLSESPDFEFESRIKVLADLYDKWSKRKKVIIKEVENGQDSSAINGKKNGGMPSVPLFRKVPPPVSMEVQSAVSERLSVGNPLLVPAAVSTPIPTGISLPLGSRFLLVYPPNMAQPSHLKKDPCLPTQTCLSARNDNFSDPPDIQIREVRSMPSNSVLATETIDRMQKLSPIKAPVLPSVMHSPRTKGGGVSTKPIIQRIVSSETSTANAKKENALTDVTLPKDSFFAASKFSASPEKVKSFLNTQEKIKNASDKLERMELMMSAFSDMLSFFI